MRRVLIIVQNLPVPFDRRVWLERQALVSAGYRVAVVCPEGRCDPSYQVFDSVDPYKYRSCTPGGSKVGSVTVYPYTLLATAWLTPRAAIFLRSIDSTKFVHHHHNLCPELYECRFPDGLRLPYKALRALERRTRKAANQERAYRGAYQRLTVGAGVLQRTGS